MHTIILLGHKPFAKIFQTLTLIALYFVTTGIVHAQTTSIPNGPMMIESAAAAKAMTDARPAYMDPMFMMLKNQMEKRVSAESTTKSSTPSFKQIGPVITNGMLSIEAMANDKASEAQLIKELESAGARNIKQNGNVLSATFAAANIGNLVNLTTARYVRPSRAAKSYSGPVNSQGDAGQRSDVARGQFNVLGKGSKIGIVSTSWDLLKGADAGIVAGELPGPGNPNGFTTPVKVLKEGLGLNAPDEGRAMAEIIHDVAPGAELTFYGPGNLFDFADGLKALAEDGAKIIVDDLGYGEIEPWFQEGQIETTMRDLTLKKNVTFISSAGNQASDSYEALFNPSAAQTLTSVDGVAQGQWQLHDFGNGQLTVPIKFFKDDSFGLAMQWDDRWSTYAPDMVGATTDLDLFLFLDPEGTKYVVSDRRTSLDADPFAGVDVVAPFDDTLYIGIGKKVDASPPAGKLKLVLFGAIETDRVNVFNKGTAVAHNGSRWSISSCAVNYPDINKPNGPILAPFSSTGGVARTRNQFGDPLPRPVVLRKPDFCSPNAGNTSFFGRDADGDGLPNFFGTSASAPHLAGVVALMQEASGDNLSAFAVAPILRFATKDMDDPATPQFDFGFDFGTGYGFVEADRAVNIASHFNSNRPRRGHGKH
jgi:hypothetical protein